MSNRKRALSLAIVGIFVFATLLYYLPLQNTQAQQPTKASQSEQSDREKLAQNPQPAGTLKDRLGKDDGYAMTLFFSADIGGNLEVCGCPIRPLGGIARRLGYINAFRVEVLPAGADPDDIRYNLIHWNHRRTRGYSYGYGGDNCQ